MCVCVSCVYARVDVAPRSAVLKDDVGVGADIVNKLEKIREVASRLIGRSPALKAAQEVRELQ